MEDATLNGFLLQDLKLRLLNEDPEPEDDFVVRGANAQSQEMDHQKEQQKMAEPTTTATTTATTSTKTENYYENFSYERGITQKILHKIRHFLLLGSPTTTNSTSSSSFNFTCCQYAHICLFYGFQVLSTRVLDLLPKIHEVLIFVILFNLSIKNSQKKKNK